MVWAYLNLRKFDLNHLINLNMIEINQWKLVEIFLTWPIFLWLLDLWQVKVIISVILRKGSGIISISYDFLLS